MLKNRIDPSHKSQNISVPYSIMQHFVTEMCTSVHISVTKWHIVGYLSDALWDLWDGSIVMRQTLSLLAVMEIVVMTNSGSISNEKDVICGYFCIIWGTFWHIMAQKSHFACQSLLIVLLPMESYSKPSISKSLVISTSWDDDNPSLTHCGLVTPYGDRDLGQHWHWQHCPVTFILGQFHKRCLNHQSLKSVWKLHS